MKGLLYILAALMLGILAVPAGAQTPLPYPYYPPLQAPLPPPPPGGYPSYWPTLPYLPVPGAYPAQAAPTPPAAVPAPAPAAAPAPAPAAAPAPAPVVVPAPTPAPTATSPGLLTNLPLPSLPVPNLLALPNLGLNPFGLFSPPQTGPRKPYTMRRVIPQAEKQLMMQLFVPMMNTFTRMEMPDAMNYFARKYKAKPGLSFDDVRESLFLRANQLNLKKVGESLMYKDFHAVLGDTTAPHIEVYSFCDIAVGRDLLKISPEFIVFLPCRVAIMEDADKNIWVLMLDWDMTWVSGMEKQLGLTDELVKGAVDVNKRMDEIMRAAANGEL